MGLNPKREQLNRNEVHRIFMASLMLFTGKGGVGKSTVSAATAQHWASQGYRTILVSSDPAHSTDDTLGVSVGLQTTKNC